MPEPNHPVPRVVPSLLGSVIAQELAGPSPGHLHSVWRSSVADTLVWGAHEVRSGQPSRFSPLGFQHSLFPRHGLARGAHAGSAQCMAMLEPWPTVSFLSHPPAPKRFPLIRPGKLSGMQASHYFASIFFDDFYLGHSVRAPGHQARGISCITWLDHIGPLGHVPFRPGSSSPPGVRQLGWRSYLCLGAITA